MSDRCEMELCPNWSGDGDVCPCAVFGLERPIVPISTLTGRPCTGHPADERCIECVAEDHVTIRDGYVHYHVEGSVSVLPEETPGGER